jgi:hypothetical protein
MPQKNRKPEGIVAKWRTHVLVSRGRRAAEAISQRTFLGCTASGGVERSSCARQCHASRCWASLARGNRALIGSTACATAHLGTLTLLVFDHEVRSISPADVSPNLCWSKNDVADAASICEATTCPLVRFVPVGSCSIESPSCCSESAAFRMGSERAET